MAIEKDIPIDGTYMHVIEFGRGPRPALMLAGASLRGIAGLGDAIEAGYECMCDDFHIFCISTKDAMPPKHTVADMAEDAARCLGILGVSRADVMGASHGGMIAMTLAIEHPEMVRSLAICGSSARVEGDAARTMRRWKALARAGDTAGLGEAFFTDLFSKEFQDAHAELRSAFVSSGGTDADCRRFVTVMDSILGFDILARLGEIKCPTLLLGADDDRVLGEEASHAIARGAGCALHIYRGLGHAFYDETPDTPRRIRDHFLAG